MKIIKYKSNCEETKFSTEKVNTNVEDSVNSEESYKGTKTPIDIYVPQK